MSDETALLAAIIAHPDEDTPRLMYADWLEENGQPERAEFIRLQCAVELDDVSKGRLFELEEWCRAKWLSGLPQGSSLEWEFRRGFPECLNGYGWLFLQQYDAIVRVPWVRWLSLTGITPDDTLDFVRRQWSPNWVELELQSRHRFSVAESTAVLTITDCHQLSQLRVLRFSLFEITSQAVHALATSPHLEYLHRLHLDGDSDNPLLAPLRKRFGDRLVIG